MKRVAWVCFIPLGLIIYGIVLSIINGKILDYFNMPLYYAINIAVAVVLAFFLTQLQNDKRKKKETVENLINRMLNSISDSRMYEVNTEDAIKYIRITHRSLRNRLDLIEHYNSEISYDEDISYISEKLNAYWEIISNHISDLTHLSNSRNELFNNITNIENRLETMIFKIYSIDRKGKPMESKSENHKYSYT